MQEECELSISGNCQIKNVCNIGPKLNNKTTNQLIPNPNKIMSPSVHKINFTFRILGNCSIDILVFDHDCAVALNYFNSSPFNIMRVNLNLDNFVLMK